MNQSRSGGGGGEFDSGEEIVSGKGGKEIEDPWGWRRFGDQHVGSITIIVTVVRRGREKGVHNLSIMKRQGGNHLTSEGREENGGGFIATMSSGAVGSDRWRRRVVGNHHRT